MWSLGGSHLLIVVVLVVLLCDSRRVRALARLTVRGRPPSSGHGLPAGADPQRVGLHLGQIQMRHHVDWEDGGLGWEGPEILEADEPGREAEPGPVEDDAIHRHGAAAGPPGCRRPSPWRSRWPDMEWSPAAVSASCGREEPERQIAASG